MEKHFCLCPITHCQHHPGAHNEGCDPCIKKNLEFGEVPNCFWKNVENNSDSKYSMANYAKFVTDYLEK